MTTESLKQFIDKYSIQHAWRLNHDREMLDVIAYIPFGRVEYFWEILTTGIFKKGGVKSIIMDGYICVWLDEVCEFYNIEISDVFPELN